MSRFAKATRKQLKLRLALCGPTGAGKTRTALKVAGFLGKRIAVIDTENRSASKYVGAPDVPEFDVLELESFAPRTYVEAIRDAEREGYDVIVIDGITQAWSGKDGALEQVDKAAKRSQTGNSFTAWRDVTPMHNDFVNAMVHCKSHLIVTMRSKTEWVLEENDRGKKVPRKIGMAPEQRNGIEFEFDVVGDLDADHNLIVTKTRCDALDGAMMNKPGREFAEKLLNWLGEGAPEAPKPAPLAASFGSPKSEVAPIATDLGPDYWRTRYSALCTVAFEQFEFADWVGEDELGLAIPGGTMPTFSDKAKKYAGVAYDKVPAGYLREVLLPSEHFEKMPITARLWATLLVARHEIAKSAASSTEAAQ